MSLIVPMYNAAAYLRECLESIASQTFTDFQALLIDDESTDSTVAIAREFCKDDSRFTLVELSHRGVSAIRNYGIEHVDTPYIGFVDADDCLQPQAIERMLDALRQTGAEVCIGEFKKGDSFQLEQFSEPTTPSTFDYENAIERALYQTLIMNSPCGILMETNLLHGDRRFREGIRYEDLDAFYRFYDGASKITYLPEQLYFYRQNPSSFMHCWDAKRLDVLDVTDRIVEYMRLRHPRLVKAAEDRRFSAHFNMLLLMMTYGVDNQDAIDRCWNVIKAGRLQALLDPKVRLKNKAGALLSYAGKRFIAIVCAFSKNK